MCINNEREDDSERDGRDDPGFASRNDSGVAKIFDREALLAMVGGDEAFLADIIALVLKTLPGQLAVIVQAVENGDPVAVERSAHALKGSMSSVFALGAANAAAILEEMGERGDLTNAAGAVRRLNDEAARLTAELHRVSDDDIA